MRLRTGTDEEPRVRRSDELARLRDGWYIVVPDGGEAGTFREAAELRKELERAGVGAYVRRIR